MRQVLDSSHIRFLTILLAGIGLSLAISGTATAYDDIVASYQKVSDTEGGFDGILDDSDFFGVAGSSLGDPDGDGVVDLVVGAYRDDDGGSDRGAVWILFLENLAPPAIPISGAIGLVALAFVPVTLSVWSRTRT